MSIPPLAVPGQILGSVSSYSAGSGTHISKGHVYASIPGPVIANRVPTNTMMKPVLTISRTGTAASGKPRNLFKYNTLPAVDSVVLARVTRVQKRQATVSILVVLDDSASQQQQQQQQQKPTTTTTMSTSDNDNMASIMASSANPENHNSTDELRFQALIRKEDVRAVEKDRVMMDEMFRVGDIVRGAVLSLGDQSFYYMTTARNDFGVVMARSEAGNMMFPVSWKEMRDSATGVGETRKVARPF